VTLSGYSAAAPGLQNSLGICHRSVESINICGNAFLAPVSQIIGTEHKHVYLPLAVFNVKHPCSFLSDHVSADGMTYITNDALKFEKSMDCLLQKTIKEGS
jgi:hypothetical protein